MESSAVTTIGLPLALGFIMLGLGLHLTVDDFKRVFQQPKAVLVGLFCQMIIMPVICYFLAKAFGLVPAMAVGLMLLAASPGGATANLFSYLFKGDVALNITLTAVNSVLTIITIPIIVNFALNSFMGTEQYIPLQFKKVIEVILIVLVPVFIGMYINYKKPDFAARMDKFVRIASSVMLILMVASIMIKERANLAGYVQSVGVAVIVFNILSMLTGYYFPKLFNIANEQRIAIAMEIGIHNAVLAIYLALNVLQNSMMSIPAAVYSITMFVTATIFGYIVSRKVNR